jgi:GGDEF domain-containing protein
MRQPVVVAGQPVVARASIGIAVAGDADITSDQLLREADSAMYSAKRDQTDGWRLYASTPSPGGTV